MTARASLLRAPREAHARVAQLAAIAANIQPKGAPPPCDRQARIAHATPDVPPAKCSPLARVPFARVFFTRLTIFSARRLHPHKSPQHTRYSPAASGE